ncbi:MAG: HAMP domain-containing protein [Candidatus Omnitrophica bacterium]|nr:HAMP domain-containing protein [Candidatus Omnitrophota bacterium]MDD5670622.1 HAMP domain-containing protein [Candidatus Omnitrophota bacterium]
MSIRIKILIGFIFVVMLSSVIGIVSLGQIRQIARPLSHEMPSDLEAIVETARLDGLAKLVRYYDEVLTQAARNYAFTKNRQWKERYLEEEPKLDAIVKEVMQRGAREDRLDFENINEANRVLVEMEYRSMKAVDLGKAEEAVTILESREYWEQKKVYQDYLLRFILSKGLRYDEAVSASSQTIDSLMKRTERMVQSSGELVLILLLLIILASLGISYYIALLISKPILALQKGTEFISSGNLDYRVGTNSRDEIGRLSRSFDLMTERLKQNMVSVRELHKEIEDRTKIDAELKKKIDALEQFRKITVDRELKMRELKNKIAELESKLRERGS